MHVKNLLHHERMSTKNSAFIQITKRWDFFNEKKKLKKKKKEKQPTTNPMWQFEQLPN